MDRLTELQKFADKINANRNPWTAEDVAHALADLESVRSEALEEAAKACEDYFDGPDDAWRERQIADELAKRIRSLADEKDVDDNELRK